MVKLVYCIRRKQGLSREEFRRYWAEVHGPIGARIPTRAALRLLASHVFRRVSSAFTTSASVTSDVISQAVMLSTIIVRSEAP
jgi:hypothetical protein